MSYAVSKQGNEKAYFLAESTVATIPPGMYTCIQQPFVGTYLQSLTPPGEKLLDIKGTPADEVMKDVRAFLSKKEQFRTYGLTHKRGYLLYGPPGTGKTCVAQLAAQRFIEDGGIVVQANHPAMLGVAAEFLNKSEPTRSLMVLLDDPDENDMNYSGVLAYLDGSKPVHGLVTILTTNYKSKLPPRLANRPGRFDRVILVDRISQAVQLAFLQDLENRDATGPRVAQALVGVLDGLPVTLAHLREAFVAHVLLGADLKEIRARFEKMASEVNDDDGETQFVNDQGEEPDGSDPFGE